MGIANILKSTARNYYNWIIPRQVTLPDSIKRIADSIYTTHPIDWTKVRFFYGLPWVLSKTKQMGATLPGTYTTDTINIYIRRDCWNDHSVEGVGLIIHEVFHAMQYRQLWNGVGVGLLRPFVIPYLSCYFTRGRLRENYIEAPAYAKEDKFMAWYKDFLHSTNQPRVTFNQDVMDNLQSKCPELKEMDKKVKFSHVLSYSTPWMPALKNIIGKLRRLYKFKRLEGAKSLMLFMPFYLPSIFVVFTIANCWMLIWNLFILLIACTVTILKPVCDGILLATNGIVWLAAGIAISAEWIIEKLQRVKLMVKGTAVKV